MIPYSRQDITKEDVNHVIETLKSDFLTQGPAVPLFEKKLCNYTDAKYAVAVNSATAALHIACLSLNLKAGDIVWTSPISFVSSANCAIYCGALVEFVDVNSDTALMSVEALKSKLIKARQQGKLPKIVIPVHFAGQSCDMKEIYKLSQEYNFQIIEDAAHAVGASYENRAVGCCQYSDITVFSFHPVKIITTGEGGVALTVSKELAERMRLFRSHGITRDSEQMTKPEGMDWYYEQISIGFNYRMSDIHASIGISQLDRVDNYIERRSEIALWYDEKLKNISVKPLVQITGNKSSYHLYVIRIKNGENERNRIFNYLRKHNILVNLHYIPIYRQPFYINNLNYKKLSGAEVYFKSALSLPIFPTITQQELNKVVTILSNSIKDL
jgi:UDP-4-amino-4,6-dideoxy-N-acetyl-beta-L-altrosamine transaminase